MSDTNFFGGPFFGEPCGATSPRTMFFGGPYFNGDFYRPDSLTHFFGGMFFNGDYFGGTVPQTCGGFFGDGGGGQQNINEYQITMRRRVRR